MENILTEDPDKPVASNFLDVIFVQFYANHFGEGNGTQLQYSCLENPMDEGAWKAAVHRVTEGRT